MSATEDGALQEDPRGVEPEPEVEILSSSRETEEDGAALETPAGEESPAGDRTDWKRLYEETRERLLWTAADLDNLRKRTLKEKEEHLKFALAGLLKELLGVADNLERALSVPEGGEASFRALKEGVELTRRQLTGLLERHGLERIPAEGTRFNPHLHEVLLQEERSDVPDETVLQELQAGWRLYERVLRPARVKVARNPSSGEKTAPQAGGGENPEPQGA